jgi:hypothetical protein
MAEPFFKIKPTKRSNPEARTTLDSLHQVQINKLLDKKTNIEFLERQKLDIQTEIDTCENIIEKNLKENQLREIEKDMQNIQGERDLYNYFF